METLYLTNARQANEDGSFSPVTVCVRDGCIAAMGAVEVPPGANDFDCGGALLAAGFIEIQLNGGFGVDFTRTPESIWQVAAQLPQYGITSFLPTIITSPLETVQRAQQVLQAGPPTGWCGAWPLGLLVEGPFLNPAKKGAHNPNYLRLPSVQQDLDWSPQTGIRIVTLAPELPGAENLVRRLKDRGVIVFAGHSLATFEQAQTAFSWGVRGGTHLFNAMPPLETRAPGLIGALLTTPGVVFGLIVDGIHVHPANVRLAWATQPDGLILVTDAMAALGMSPGTYCLGDFDVQVDQVSARLVDGTLAGSILTANTAVANLAKFVRCSPAQALAAFSARPADLLGLQEYGRLRVGNRADLTLLDWEQDAKVLATFVAGQLVYQRSEA
jgi:N-acetylglucosamine-6-phosphate deacetylase